MKLQTNAHKRSSGVTETSDPISEFATVVDVLYGVYLDATTGFKKFLEFFEKMQKDTISRLAESDPSIANLEYLDGRLFHYGEGAPDDKDSEELHRTTQGHLKQRNSPGGMNFRLIANMTIVLIYQYWEDDFRGKIAEFLGVTKSSLTHSAMGDLRLYRRSIIHNGGVAWKDIDRCEIFPWYSPGDLIDLDKDRIKTIVKEIDGMIQSLREEAARSKNTDDNA